MLYWHANFQIPNSGAQAADVYAVATLNDTKISVNFYADSTQAVFLFNKEYAANNGGMTVYQYLLTLDDFKEYEIVI